MIIKISVHFKEFIEKFLHKSLRIYLQYNEERKKIINEYDEMMRIIKENDFGNNKENKFDIKKENEEKEIKNIEAIIYYFEEIINIDFY